MEHIFQPARASAALLLPDRPVGITKVHLRKAENDPYYAQLGACIEEVRHVFGLTLKEFAAELGKDERQVQRQIEGKERPQIEAVFAVQRFQGPLVIALARLATGVEVDTVHHIRYRKQGA